MSHTIPSHPKTRPLVHGVAALVLAAGLALAGSATAADSPAQGGGTPQEMTPAQREQIKSFMQTRQELMQVREKLQKIQEKAVDARPQLQKKQAHFAALVEKQMKSQGHSPKQELAEIQALQDKLKSGDVSGGEQQALMQQLQQKATQYQQAQLAALKDDQIRSAREDLMKDILTAMKEEDPKTEDLMQTMRQKQQKLEQIHEQVLGKQGGQ